MWIIIYFFTYDYVRAERFSKRGKRLNFRLIFLIIKINTYFSDKDCIEGLPVLLIAFLLLFLSSKVRTLGALPFKRREMSLWLRLIVIRHLSIIYIDKIESKRMFACVLATWHFYICDCRVAKTHDIVLTCF